eukprot:scaffold50378_cov17-Tisochrysis_lutea.AAC.1
MRMTSRIQCTHAPCSCLQNPWMNINGTVMKLKPHKCQDQSYQELLALQQREGRLKLMHFRRVKQLGAGDVGLVDLVQLQVRRWQAQRVGYDWKASVKGQGWEGLCGWSNRGRRWRAGGPGAAASANIGRLDVWVLDGKTSVCGWSNRGRETWGW